MHHPPPIDLNMRFVQEIPTYLRRLTLSKMGPFFSFLCRQIGRCDVIHCYISIRGCYVEAAI